jgi:hypothetical protein
MIHLIVTSRRNQLIRKGLVVEPSTTLMDGSMVWLRRQEVVIPKYHRVL